VGVVHHIAYAVSREVYERAVAGLEAAGHPNSGRVDRGFMDSLYFRDPNGSLVELSVNKFTTPEGHSIGEVLGAAHRLRLQQGDYAITEKHLQEAIAQLERS
jgi:catechol-2,3-dioxygenase